MQLREQTLSQLKDIKTASIQEQVNLLNDLRIAVLGKKSDLTQVMKQLKDASEEERKIIGALANDIRQTVTQAVENARETFEAYQLEQALASQTIDVTLPGNKQSVGTTHLLTRVLTQLEDLFMSMGYDVVEGPEVETDLYNFGKMNLPKNHPARDMQDTFYINEDILLRTQTSPVQARTMEKHDFSKGPLKMISPGKVYRRDDDDATHSHQFQQIEGLVIDKHITMADLKGTLQVVAKEMFGEDRQIRLRPSYFPFTEPSVEVDVSCFKCGGQGCAVCKRTGWIEVLGAGMVHPNVLEMSGVDSTVYGGFAFGMGLERFAMLKYGVDDIRHFYQNDVRFLNQFSVIMEGEE
ncbi:phenylalanine--tRNA ligase subunit alpha [Carnobacteriaceae bacterium zg-ZUI78]|nr:phenylalanine--tRNA ligase subunit alpha [Carnobacteriaceae bacterium zg-ZUI78]QMI86632.1 phenylalanine--tRNA ligase subunit alpha [Carnobacteriaceae bacterium zg-84]